MNVDESTGELLEPGTDVELVTLNLAGLNEAELLALFPTPVQCAGALLKARVAVTRAPAVLNEYRTALADRERDLTIALAKAARDLLADYPRMPMTERRDLARAEASAVREAQEARDTAWLLLQYAKDRKDSLFEDIGHPSVAERESERRTPMSGTATISRPRFDGSQTNDVQIVHGYQRPDVPWNGLTVTDLFCGAGGSSSGLVEAGYKIVIAANHWALAIESHQINHPDTDHSQADISQVDPRYFPRTHVLWGSPECTNHSIAKGVKRQRQQDLALFELDGTRPLPDEAANRSRATMWDIPRFAEHHRYMAIILENVVDAYRWDQFEAWRHAMDSLGYRMQFVWLNSMHAQIGGLPAPQSRDRMYIVMWRADLVTKKNPGPNIGKWTRPEAVCLEHGLIRAVQAFKKKEQWGRYRAQYLYRCPECWQVVEPGWLPASSIIDWSLPAPRIGDREKPLAEKTRERIRRGIERYWAPFVAKAAGNTYDGVTTGSNYLRIAPVEDPMPIQTGTAEHGLAVPPAFLAQFRQRDRTQTLDDALPTVVADGANHALIVNNLSGADESRSRPISDALPSLVAGGNHASLLVPVEGREGKSAASAADPLRTQSTRNETGLLVPAGGTWRDDTAPLSDPLAARTTRETDGLLVPLRNHGVAKPSTAPIDTVSAEGNHHALVMRNNQGGAEMSTPVVEPLRALTTKGHQSLIEPPAPISLDVDDAGFRMLEPHEIQAGMGFARDYVLMGSKRDKVKQAGNAVTPPAARDLGFAVAEFLLAVAA